MLQRMLDIQTTVSETLEIPRDMDSVQQAVVGVSEEAVNIAEAMEDARLEPKVLETLNLNKADCSAVAAFTYLLQYFVLRDWTADDIEQAYLMLVGEIVQVHQVAEGVNETFFNMLKSVLTGDLEEAVKAFNIMEAEVELMNSLNALELKDACLSLPVAEQAALEMEKERLDKVMQEAIGPDFSPDYTGPGGW